MGEGNFKSKESGGERWRGESTGCVLETEVVQCGRIKRVKGEIFGKRRKR